MCRYIMTRILHSVSIEYVIQSPPPFFQNGAKICDLRCGLKVQGAKRVSDPEFNFFTYIYIYICVKKLNSMHG